MKKNIRVICLIVAAVLLSLSLCGCKVYEPEVKYGEFPFVIEYEKDGEHYLIEDTLIYSFDGYDPSCASVISWDYSTQSGDMSYHHVFCSFGAGTQSLFDENRFVLYADVSVYLNNGHYFMGEEKSADWKPCFEYVERFNSAPNIETFEKMELSEAQMEEMFGIKIIRLEYSEPIENRFIEVGQWP